MSTQNGTLTIKEQGSFAAGGTVITCPGQFDPKDLSATGALTLHGDYLYTFYQIPENARQLPLTKRHCSQYQLHGSAYFLKISRF
ncbi:hypothetical protein [Desulfosediminicola flagellatus]|uniref:hypothetical protein n=1 Tax=Desulfosediminicola flagellatus TaxID=2569541 RepID=UPI0010AC5343|nr:hypothetical protein [Desulfosediminicola flagellatus]